MKLFRYGPIGAEKPGIVDFQGNFRDLSGVLPDISGPVLTDASLECLQGLELEALPLIDSGVRMGPCVGAPGKFLAIGLNYLDHAKEANLEAPSEPVVFTKWNSCISGPNDDVVIPRGSVKTDWEVELGVVIGQPAKEVPVARALDHVAGYCVVNDISEREWQLEHGVSWDKGKGFDTFGPIGPWLVTRDEIPDPQSLDLWLEVDGVRYQSGNTRDMIFSVAELISYLSRLTTLQAGDIITTGTPAGVGMGQKPVPVYLKPGQRVRLGVTGLGEQLQRMTGG